MSNQQKNHAISVHDIERDGVRYIMEWDPDEETVSITQAMTCGCADECPHEDVTRCDLHGPMPRMRDHGNLRLCGIHESTVSPFAVTA